MLLALAYCNAAFSQKTLMDGQYFQDGTGKLIRNEKNINDEIEGNPYLPETWAEGVVYLKNGQKLKYKSLKYNMFTGELEYQWGNENYVVTQPMIGFSINEMVFNNGFPTTEKCTDKTFFQVLYSGKNKLICNKSVQILGVTPFVTVTTKARQYQQNDSYFVAMPEKVVKIKKDKKSILQVFPEKETQIEAFCKKEGLKFRKWEDVVTLLSYLETL